METDGFETKIAARRRRAYWLFFGTAAILGASTLFFAASGVALRQREAARNERCENNLRRVCQAFAEYRDANGTYPPAFATDAEGRKLHSWRVLLLPFLGEAELFAQIRLDEPWDSEWNSQFHPRTPNVFKCASTPEKLGDKSCRCSFSVVVGDEESGVETAFRADGRPVAAEEIRDGAGNAILCVERKSPVCWMAPDVELTASRILEENEKPFRERVDFGCWHKRGANALFFDGSTRFLSEKIDGGVLRLLLGIADASRPAEKSDDAETPVAESSAAAEN